MPTVTVGGFAPGVNVSLYSEAKASAARHMSEPPPAPALAGPSVADAAGVASFSNITAGIALVAYGARRVGGTGYVQALYSTTKGWPS